MRTGTVATIDNRNWELRDQRGPVQRLSQSRAIALDMESATIAANGFRFRVPYGTLLCVSDKPLHGELKLPGMATDFYKRQVAQHLTIGSAPLEKLAAMPQEGLHSRKLRSFSRPRFNRLPKPRRIHQARLRRNASGVTCMSRHQPTFADRRRAHSSGADWRTSQPHASGAGFTCAFQAASGGGWHRCCSCALCLCAMPSVRQPLASYPFFHLA